MSFTNLTRTDAEIIDTGSGRSWHKHTKADGTDLTTPDTYGELPESKDSKLTPSISTAEQETEGKRKISTGASESWKFSSTYMQRGEATLHTMWKEGKFKYGIIIKELTEDFAVDGNYQYYGILAKMISWSGIESPALNPSFEWDCIKAPADITINLETAGLDNATADMTGATLVIPKGDYYGFVSIAEA